MAARTRTGAGAENRAGHSRDRQGYGILRGGPGYPATMPPGEDISQAKGNGNAGLHPRRAAKAYDFFIG